MTGSHGPRARSSSVLPRATALLLLVAVPLLLGIRAGAQSPFEGKGKVVALDPANQTVTLDHGPIPGLMPPMRMRFPVQPVEELRKLKVGDMVRFSLGSRGDEMIIATIERLDEPPPAPR
ncbi:MAG TPA: copper-binding protein [Candidatus Methylomirabilis sp.]|nr:copper-binding protein [Candidatus Methylomirabilis sp.]